ncbi:zinc chelation protein SecC [Neisseria gonorrhoeae]
MYCLRLRRLVLIFVNPLYLAELLYFLIRNRSVAVIPAQAGIHF